MGFMVWLDKRDKKKNGWVTGYIWGVGMDGTLKKNYLDKMSDKLVRVGRYYTSRYVLLRWVIGT